jgi:Skp family chaperone for outer membrane proteins
MKKINTLLIVGAFILGLGVNNFARSDVLSKIAVVDVNRVVSNSSQVMALKKEQNLKMEELQKWLNTARADVEKQKTQEGKEKLAKKYDSDFVKKQQAIQKDYTDKLQSIDKDISGIIAKTAKDKGYDFVLAKGVVLYGGDDITNTISKLIK